jgi:hypothetical protein
MQMRTLILGTVLVGIAAGCSADQLNVTNPNVATVEGASADPTALQLLATGLQAQTRLQRAGFITNAGVFGRESYTLTPQEGRNVTHPLLGITVNGVQKLDPTGFAVGPWAGQYGVLRDVFNFKQTVAAAALTASQKSAALGFARTIEAQMLFDIVQTRDTLGGIVEIKENAADLALFVSRDSMYKYILNTLDAADAELRAGGTAFPFTLGPGYAGFTTPTTHAQWNRALKAKVSAHYATAGGGAAAWQAALTALQGSFLNAAATTRAQLDNGVYATYAVSPDSPNGLAAATNSTLYGHMSFQTDAQRRADGSLDLRFTSKTRALPARTGPVTAAGPTTGTSTLGFNIWPLQNSPIAYLRNEELILLRAEARLATGDKAGAIADLNQVRVNSGGLPATTLTAASTNDQILDGILYEKRYSTMMEGNRWIDMRRYNRLGQLPLDVATGPNRNFVARVNPIPQGECLVRARAGKAPGILGPGTQDNCAP